MLDVVIHGHIKNTVHLPLLLCLVVDCTQLLQKVFSFHIEHSHDKREVLCVGANIVNDQGLCLALLDCMLTPHMLPTLQSICSALALASNNLALPGHQQMLPCLGTLALPWQMHLLPSCISLPQAGAQLYTDAAADYTRLDVSPAKAHTWVAQGCMLLQVQEIFGDFVVLDSQHFCIPLPRPHVVLQPFSWDYANSTDAVTRMTEGLASLTLSLRRRFNIRCAHVCFACTFTVLFYSHLI